MPGANRKIDRIALFTSKLGLQRQPGDTFNDPEYDTYTGRWQNSPSATILSFRAAKALQINATIRIAMKSF